MIHITRRTGTGIQDPDDIRITLPTIPGIELDTTRSDTAPRLPMIRRPVAHGAAMRAKAQPRIAAFIEAIREARDEMGANE